MLSLSKITTAAAVAVALVAGQGMAFVSNAQARDGRHDRIVRGPVSEQRRYSEPRRDYGYRHHKERRDHTGDAVVGAILGIGALIVGASIAEAHRNKRYHDED